MKKYLRLVFTFIAVSIFLSSLAQAGEAIRKPRLAIDFSLQDLKGKTYRLSDYKDKQPVVLFFWTTECPLCRPELRALNILYPTLQKEGIEVLAIDVNEPGYRVDKFAQKNALSMPILLDRDTQVARDYFIPGVPAIIIVNQQGNIVYEGDHFPTGIYKKLIAQ
jgi:peroxiredoxin